MANPKWSGKYPVKTYLKGETIGRCIYLEEIYGRERRYVKVECQCGVIFISKLCNVKRGVCCGCNTGKIRNKQGALFMHGKSKSEEYNIWNSMKDRCFNPNNKSYPNYGGRGIKVCDRWMFFINFMNDMGMRPSSKHSIDRKNNDGNYEPSNCKWVTKSEQARNTRGEKMLTLDGDTKKLWDWYSIYGIKPSVIKKRLNIGWTIEKAIKSPIHVQNKKK